MARILLAIPPLVGHFNPALDLAASLTRRGHRVAWALDDLVLGAHLPADELVYSLAAHPFLGPVDDGGGRQGLESLLFQFEVFMPSLARATFTPLETALSRFGPDLMLVDHQMVSGAFVAAKHDVPWLSLVTTPASIQAAPQSWTQWVQGIFAALQEEMLPSSTPTARPDLSPRGAIVFSAPALAGDVDKELRRPIVFVGPAGGRGRRQSPFPWEWLDPARPLLLATMGTISRDRDPRFFNLLLAALEGLPLQAVLVAPAELAGSAPCNVMLRTHVPQLALLDHATAVLCHGGHNTVCEALARGLPLAIAPIRDDQPFIARQVAHTGAGFTLRYGKVGVDDLAKAVRRLLEDPVLGQAARQIAPQFQLGGAENGADLVERVLAGGTIASSAQRCG